jgi:hypothetical protein
MSTLLDGLTDALPLMGGLSVSIRTLLLEELWHLTHWVALLGITFLSMAGLALALKGLAAGAAALSSKTVAGTFLTILAGGHFATKKPRPADSTVDIKVRKFKIGWQGTGVLVLGVAGILLILLDLFAKSPP